MKVKLLIFLMILPLINSSQADAADELKACGHHDYAPWNWNKEGEIVGVCAEITKTLFGNLGFTVDLSFQGPWARCQVNIETGLTDINICSFINEKRRKYSEFILTPMGVNENAVFIKKGSQLSFTKWSDLKGKNAGMVIGVSIGQHFDDFMNEHLKIQKVNSFLQAFKMLELDRLDFVPTGRYSGKAMLLAYGLDRQITDLPNPILYGNLHISMSKKSQYLSLLPEIEKAIQKKNYKTWVVELLDKYSKIYADDFKKENSN